MGRGRHTGTGFPRVFYLRYHWYCQYFPLWALAMYRNLRSRGKMRADEVRQHVQGTGCIDPSIDLRRFSFAPVSSGTGRLKRIAIFAATRWEWVQCGRRSLRR